jgi:hypothetical protein
VGNSVPAAVLVEVGRAVTVGITVAVVVVVVAALVGANVGWSKSVGWIVGAFWTVISGDGLGATLDVRKLLLLEVVVALAPAPPF